MEADNRFRYIVYVLKIDPFKTFNLVIKFNFPKILLVQFQEMNDYLSIILILDRVNKRLDQMLDIYWPS